MAWKSYPDSEEIKAKWNMDEAVLRTIHQLKDAFIISMKKWDLEDAYWNLRQIRMEADAKFREQEQKKLTEEFEKLEELRGKFLKNKNEHGKLYSAYEKAYMMINRYMKDHGLYFRENEDVGL